MKEIMVVTRITIGGQQYTAEGTRRRKNKRDRSPADGSRGGVDGV